MSAKRNGKKTRAAVGFRAHCGWSAFVVLAGSPRSPIVLDRGRVELVERDTQWFKQPYHAAAAMDLKDAEEFLKRGAKAARQSARRALVGIVQQLAERGHEIAACGVVLGSGRALPPLASTLASHALIHTADGIFFREALLCAGEDCKLPVTGVAERELLVHGAAVLRIAVEQLPAWLAAMRTGMGPPWGRDEKYAALVAWLALGTLARK